MKEIFNFIESVQTNTKQSQSVLNKEASSLEDVTSKLRVKLKNRRTKKRETFQPNIETVQMLRWLLDYTTHLNSYPCPISPELAHFIVAKEDAYVPRNGVSDVQDLWPGKN